MAYESQDAGMPAFLLIAAIANVWFLVQAIKDVHSSAHAEKDGKPSPPRPAALGILALACAELTWVVPCFVQCVMVFFGGHDGPWAPDQEDGCAFQGFYSQFGSLAGMMATLQIAYITLKLATKTELPSSKSVICSTIGLFGLAFVVSLLPLVGVGEYKYSGEGFCYTDFHNKVQMSLMILITVPCFFAVLGIYTYVLARTEWQDKFLIALMMAGYVAGWILWIPGLFIGISGGAYPTGYMISGAILGHAQALINPYLYGYRWRAHVAENYGHEGKGLINTFGRTSESNV